MIALRRSFGFSLVGGWFSGVLTTESHDTNQPASPLLRTIFLFGKYFSRSFRADSVSWVLVSQAGGKRAKRRVPFFSAALWAFAVRPLLGCLNGFASVLFVSPIRAMLRWPNPLEAARETHCAMH